MRQIFTDLRSAAIVSSLLVLPLVSLEMRRGRRFDEPFPFALFGILWLLPVIFILMLLRVGRTRWPRDVLRTHSRSLWARVGVLILVACLWISVLLDQIPCFLGVPNCD